MSRSIHETRAALRRERRFEYADGAAKGERLTAIRAALRRKVTIRDQVRRKRREAGASACGTAPEAIPILVRDEGPFVHQPASPDDVRAVLALLPPGVSDGLGGIELSLGRERFREMQARDGGEEQDPLVGRYGGETLPGVYCGAYLGAYRHASRINLPRITLYAYVYDPTRLERRGLAPLSAYLRLRALATLVHEVAHHFDASRRVARGRWRMDSEEANELYAERWEQEWTQSVVVPYLERTYPADVAALFDWVEEHGGLRTSLPLLAGDARARVRGNRWSVFNGVFSVHAALSGLARDVADREGRLRTRVQFARELHYAGRYDEALDILGRLLGRRPRLREPRLLTADIYVHQERFAEAARLARRLFAEDPSDTEALTHLADALEGLCDCRGLLRSACRLIRRHRGDPREQFSPRLQRARALLHLGRFEDADAELSRLERTETRRGRPRRIRAVREEWEVAGCAVD